MESSLSFDISSISEMGKNRKIVIMRKTNILTIGDEQYKKMPTLK